MKRTWVLTATPLALGLLLGTAPLVPAQAMPIAAMEVGAKPAPDLVQVRDHRGRRDHHRADHRFHGRDDYYDRDDQSGVLFKSFITGTLFRPR